MCVLLVEDEVRLLHRGSLPMHNWDRPLPRVKAAGPKNGSSNRGRGQL